MKKYIKPEILTVKIGIANMLLTSGGSGKDDDGYDIPVVPDGEGDASEEGC